MSEVNQRIAQLSSEQRIALEKRLLAGRKNGRAQHIGKRPNGAPAPLSFAQERLWFLSSFEPDSAAYNEMQIIRMTGALDIKALERSLDAVSARHDSLRICIREVGGTFAQVDAPLPPTKLPIVDLTTARPHEQTETSWDTIERFQHEIFDLSQAPLWRAKLIRLAHDDHIFVRVVHHIVSDGWSASILWRELGHYYRAYSAGQEAAELPALAIDYGDYAAWQREQLRGDRLKAQVDFWRAKLTGVVPLDLPTDRPRPQQLTHQGKVEHFVIGQHILEPLASLARANGASLYIVLLAAFQVLLHRYSGQNDIPVGSPIANRTRAEVEGIIGFFVNTLVLRADCSGNPTFRSLLAQVRAYALDAYAHQDMPFEKLVEELHPARALNRNPLFDVFFALQNVPQSVMDLPGLTCERVVNADISSKFDLSLYLTERSRGLDGRFEYATDLFNESTIRRLIGHFQTILQSIIANPDCPIDELDLLTANERHMLLVEWNDTAADYPRQATIHSLFQEQAQRTPSAVAIVDTTQTLTYEAVEIAANQLAHHLIDRGVRPGAPIGICLERSAQLVIAMLACIKAGAAWLPLDPSNPAERLVWMADDAGISTLITTSALAGNFASASDANVLLDEPAQLLDAQPKSAPVVTTDGADIAYYLYTSGSSGRPKGIVAAHRGAINRFAWMWRSYPFAPGEVACQRAAASFVDSVWEIFGPLLQGCPIVIAPDATVRDPRELVSFMRSHHVSRVTVVPALLAHMLDVYAQQHPAEAHYPRVWICSGETLSAHLVTRFKQLLPEARLLNLYGSSEVAGDVTWWDAQGHADNDVIVPIGRPIANTQIYVLDAHRRPVPIGVAGELYAGGDGVALGYLNQPELSAERFLDNPFTPGLDGRLFRSGDLARYREDGHIEYLGRRDRQIKIRGVRMEPGEIEAAAVRHPDVQTAVIGTRRDAMGSTILICWWESKPNTSIDSDALRIHLRTLLPDTMIPSHFVQVDAFPKTTSGKIDHNRLPEPAEGPSSSSASAPVTALEMQLLAIWQQVLGRKSLGVEDNFFDAGGHSLLAVRLLSKVAESTGKELPVASLFYGPTIRQQAELLQSEGWEPKWKTLVPIQPGGSRPLLFMVPPEVSSSIRFAELARELGPEQPFFSFDPPGLNGEAPPLDSVEEIAATYLAEARSIQPNGPYLFGGMCFGAHVALEMAQQAIAEGEQVPLIIALDAGQPENGPTWNRNQRQFNRNDFMRSIKLNFTDPAIATASWRKLTRPVRKAYVRFRYQFIPNGRAKLSVQDGHEKARITYVAKPYEGKIILLQSGQLIKNGTQQLWYEIADRGIECVPFPDTTHASLLRDMPRMAPTLNEAIDRWMEEFWDRPESS